MSWMRSFARKNLLFFVWLRIARNFFPLGQSRASLKLKRRGGLRHTFPRGRIETGVMIPSYLPTPGSLTFGWRRFRAFTPLQNSRFPVIA